MGIDIAIFAEKLVDGSWQPIPEPHFDKRSRRWSPIQALEIGRPLELFSLLAGDAIGLRSQLADVPALFKPRGFPKDMNKVYAQAFCRPDDPKGRKRGASWVSLSELLAVDWEQRVQQHAYVDSHYAELFDKDKAFPADFAEEARLYHDIFQPPPPDTIKVFWSISLKNWVGCSEDFIRQLSSLASGREIRIIFWFEG